MGPANAVGFSLAYMGGKCTATTRVSGVGALLLLLLRVRDGRRQPPRLALHVARVPALVAHLPAGHGRGLGRRPQPRPGDHPPPDDERAVVQEALQRLVRLEQLAQLRRRVSPPVVVVAAHQHLAARPLVQPLQVLEHLRGPRGPRDVPHHQHHVLGTHLLVPGALQRAAGAPSSRSGACPCCAWRAGGCRRWRRDACPSPNPSPLLRVAPGVPSPPAPRTPQVP